MRIRLADSRTRRGHLKLAAVHRDDERNTRANVDGHSTRPAGGLSCTDKDRLRTPRHQSGRRVAPSIGGRRPCSTKRPVRRSGPSGGDSSPRRAGRSKRSSRSIQTAGRLRADTCRTHQRLPRTRACHESGLGTSQGIAKEWPSARTASTGQGAVRITFSATLPSRACTSPPRPWVPSTTRSMSCART